MDLNHLRIHKTETRGNLMCRQNTQKHATILMIGLIQIEQPKYEE